MAADDFPIAFKRFVAKNIHSVEQIEVLLLLRAEPERDWTPQGISTMLRSAEQSIRSRLDGLVARSLAVRGEGGYRYAAHGADREMVEMLRVEYERRLYKVIDLVFSRPDAARSFADAFRLRDEDEQ